MEQKTIVTTTSRIGERGRLMLPVQVQRAALLTKGDMVVVRATEDGTVIVEPIRVLMQRLRDTFRPLLADQLPAGPARLHYGGHLDELPPGDTDVLPLELRELDLPDWPAVLAATEPADEPYAVLTARAVLAWLTAEPGSVVDAALPHAVLPETAVTELITTMARAGAHAQADPLLTDLALLGVQMPSSDEHRATLAGRTATALEHIASAARVGFDVSLPDALCAATAYQLGLPLIAADLLTPTGTPAPGPDIR
jgi:bifunctional DNA-binding transcriptional regulator/antitoxin component of YhaV-PrlF toxin-antitoxin module